MSPRRSWPRLTVVRCVVLAALAAALASCTGVTTNRPLHTDGTKHTPSEGAKEAEARAKQGMAAYRRGDHREALEAFQRVVTLGADTPVVALSRLYIAKAHFALGEFGKAAESLRQLERRTLPENLRREARQLAYLLLHQRDGCAAAEKESAPPLTVERDLRLSRRLLVTVARCRVQLGRWALALEVLELVPAAFDNKEPALNEWVLHWQRRIVRRKLPDAEVERLLSSKLAMVRPILLVRALKLASGKGERSRVESLLKQLQHERLGPLDAALVKEIELRWHAPQGDEPEGVVLAVIPRSGSWKTLGEQVARGMMAALRVFGANGPGTLRVQLVDARDPRGIQPLTALIRSSPRVLAVVGLVPDKSRYAALVSTLESEQLPAVLFTSRPRFSKPYHLGVFPDPMGETDALVAQLLREQRAPRCAVIRGVRTIDRLRAQRFARELAAKGGRIVAELTFEHQLDFSQKVKRLRGHSPSCFYLPLSPALAGLVLRYLAGVDVFPKKPSDRLVTSGKSRQVWIGGCASWQHKELIAQSERYLQGVEIPVLFRPSSGKEGSELERYVKGVFAADIEPLQALGFLALSLVASSCGKSCTRGSLVTALSAWKGGPTPFGPVTRTNGGALRLDQKICALRGAALVPLN